MMRAHAHTHARTRAHTHTHTHTNKLTSMANKAQLYYTVVQIYIEGPKNNRNLNVACELEVVA